MSLPFPGNMLSFSVIKQGQPVKEQEYPAGDRQSAMLLRVKGYAKSGKVL